jgi:predicted RNase H-like HicB family nuclease
MMRLLIVVEETPTGYSAYSPDVPGCVATGGSRAEVEAAMREAIAFHIEGLHEAGLDTPAPHSYAVMVEVAA